MNIPITLHGPAHPTWSHLVQWWRKVTTRRAWPQPRDADDGLDSLLDLDAHTLDDIGAPERLRWRAHAHREAQQLCLADLRAGLGGTDWRHW